MTFLRRKIGQGLVRGLRSWDLQNPYCSAELILSNYETRISQEDLRTLLEMLAELARVKTAITFNKRTGTTPLDRVQEQENTMFPTP